MIEICLSNNASLDRLKYRLKFASYLLIIISMLGLPALLSITALIFFVEMDFRTAGMRKRAFQAELMWVLAIAVKTGRPLAEEIDSYANDVPPKRRRLLEEMALRLRHGESLPEVAGMQGLLPASAVMQLYSGISTDELQASLNKTAIRLTQELAEDEQDGPRGVACFYPVAMMTVTCLICGFVMYYIIPKFKKIFDDFGTELPGITILLIKVSDAAVNYWYLLGAPIFYGGVMVLICVLYGIYDGWRSSLRSTLGRFWIRFYAPDVLRILGEGISQNRPVDEVLSKVIERPIPRKLRRALSYVSNQTQNGTPFWQALRKSRFLNAQESGLLETAQTSGNLPWALETLAATIENRWYFRLLALFEILQPAGLLCVSFVIAFVVIGLFMPIVKLLNDLS